MTGNGAMQVVSLTASALLLGAYWQLIRQRWHPLSWHYLIINGMAGLLFLTAGIYDWRYGGMTTNGVFLLMNLWAMHKKRRSL